MKLSRILPFNPKISPETIKNYTLVKLMGFNIISSRNKIVKRM